MKNFLNGFSIGTVLTILLFSSIMTNCGVRWDFMIVNDKCFHHGNSGRMIGRNIVCADGTVYHVNLIKTREAIRVNNENNSQRQ